MKRALKNILALALPLLLASCGGGSVPTQFSQTDAEATIYPDYKNVVVPANIAPMNFIVHEGAENYAVRLTAGGKQLDAFAGADGKIDFPENEWKTLLGAAKNGRISVEVYAEKKEGWVKFRDFALEVAPETIDDYVSYRLIEPGYEVYRQVGLYQRNLTNFDVHTIYENNRSFKSNENHCVNCHNYQNYSAKNMLFHIRGEHGGTLFVRNGKPEKMNMKCDSILSSAVYPTWHPRKPWVVFSSNKTGQTFHLLDKQKIEVLDTSSDLVFYDAEHKKLRNILKTRTDLETFPCWAPDGKTLYYCVAHVPDLENVPDSMLTRYMPEHYKELHYNIMKLDFDETTGAFGAPQLVVDCAAMGKSASVPRVSPDGRYLLFTLGDYGQFHIWHHSADLYVKDLQTGEVRALKAANSNDAESYHAWSSNGRWIVFTSRRDDGSYTRLYVSYFDKNGKEHKPFLIPQRDPEQNILLLKSYNVPEMTRDAVDVSAEDFKKTIYGSDGTAVGYEPAPKK